MLRDTNRRNIRGERQGQHARSCGDGVAYAGQPGKSSGEPAHWATRFSVRLPSGFHVRGIANQDVGICKSWDPLLSMEL